MQLYSKNNVIDINNNKHLFNYNKCKEIFCSNCKKDALFSKFSHYFMKCLNCEHCECRFCFKDIQNGHFDINDINRCKVLYRYKDPNTMKNPLYFLYLMQLFFVFAIFFMIFISVFLNTKKFFENIFRIAKKDNNHCTYYIKMSFIIIFSSIILLIIFPLVFIFFCIPYNLRIGTNEQVVTPSFKLLTA